MKQKILFQNLPTNIQDDLRDAPIVEISKGIVRIDLVQDYQGKLYQFYLDLSPRNMSENAIIYITQDLQDVEVSLFPIEQTISA